jgi:GMP synthase (glutamine-hydrolysing)
MILIVNVCADRLSHLEFVKPIENLVQKTGAGFSVTHMLDLEADDVEKAEKTVICGTALKDFSYLDHLDRFEWIKHSHKPVLGICAGMQIMMILFGGQILDRTRIGRSKVKIIRRNILFNGNEFLFSQLKGG